MADKDKFSAEDQAAIDRCTGILGSCIVRRISGGKTLIMMNVDVELTEGRLDEMWITTIQPPPPELRKKLPEESLNYKHDHLLMCSYDWANLEKTFTRWDDDTHG